MSVGRPSPPAHTHQQLVSKLYAAFAVFATSLAGATATSTESKPNFDIGTDSTRNIDIRSLGVCPTAVSLNDVGADLVTNAF